MGSDKKPKFDLELLRVQLRLLKCRLENLGRQLKNSSGGRRREIASLLSQGLEERARVNVKYLIRDDYLLEAYELLLSATEDVLQSAALLARERALDAELAPPVYSLLYAVDRVEAPELERVRVQLAALLGDDACDVSSEEGRALVDARLVVRLSIRTPEGGLAERYMRAIAETYGVAWAPPERDECEPGEAAGAGESPAARAVMPDVPTSAPRASAGDGAQPRSQPPSYPSSAKGDSDDEDGADGGSTGGAPQGRTPTFEELTERFMALKKR